MFNSIGVGEILVVAVIALIVMGPEKFPEFAKIAMRAFRDLRGYVDDIKKEMGNELRPVKREFSQLSRYKPEEYIEKIATAVTAAVDDEPESGESSTPGVEAPATATATAETPIADAGGETAGGGETGSDTAASTGDESGSVEQEYRYED